jgi:hypothetical protein
MSPVLQCVDLDLLEENQFWIQVRGTDKIALYSSPMTTYIQIGPFPRLSLEGELDWSLFWRICSFL